MMRIGISTSVIQRGRSGIGQYLLALVQHMLSAQTAHHLVLFVLEDDLSLFGFARGSCTLIPVPEAYRSPVKDIWWHHSALPRLAKSHGLDVLHIPSYRRLIWSRPCGLVATIHDLAPFRLPKKYDVARMFYGRVVARSLATRQDQIITSSKSTYNDVRQYFKVPEQKLRIIYNGIDSERFRPGAPAGVRQNLPGLPPEPFFLYVARLEHPAKNHTRLITAFEHFKSRTGSPWHLVFAGSDWHGAEVIHSRIASSPFSGAIRSLGFVPNETLPDLYRAAEVFVYPSLFEGFGLPPVEAMACGTPVISSACGSLGEVVGNAALLVDPLDEHKMSKALEFLANSPTERHSLRVRGIQRAARFDWNTAARETLETYENAAIKHEPGCRLPRSALSHGP